MRYPLLGAAYAGRSVIASGQEAINLIAESNAKDPQAPTPVTYYPTPGTVLYADPNNPRNTRCTYRTSKGTAYVVVGATVYFLDSTQHLSIVGFIADRPSQVYMADNGSALVIVDGANGYAVDMASNDFGQIVDPAFYGADFVVYLDTFFIFNRPATNQFYISGSIVNFGMLTNSAIDIGTIVGGGTGVKTGAISAAGSLYVNAVYLAVPLTGGTGTGAKADITVSGGAVTVVTNIVPGTGYGVGNVLSASNANLGGAGSGFTFTIATLDLYTNGLYQNVPLTGGSGSGAIASSFTVSGGVVTAVAIGDGGKNYLIGDVLSAAKANIGGTGSGFTWTATVMATAFDALDIAAKSGSADPIVGMTTTHQELWLIGALTTEVWIGTGAADFFFQEQQGAYIDHGCTAQYSIANIDILQFWISQDKQGNGIILQGANYQVKEISTPRVLALIKNYVTLTDAIGFCFQVSDHAFYCLTFPRANKTWLYDLTTELWSEWNWSDSEGNLNRSRANCAMFAYGKNIIGDWENGTLLTLEPDVFTDLGYPIVRIRTFPHIMKNGDRVSYKQFTADVSVGNYNDQNAAEPMIYLSWSDDRGVTYGNPVAQSLGSLGEYLTQPSWNRLGQARDRVFKLQHSAPMNVAINGAFIDTVPAKS